MSTFEQIAQRIITEQEAVIGPLAWSEAQKVPGLTVDAEHHAATLAAGDPKGTIDTLVARYERLFGQASHDVCKEAAAPLLDSLSPTDIPQSLRLA